MLSAASQSQVRTGLDKVFQISFVLPSPQSSFLPGHEEMQLQTDVPTTPDTLETPAVFILSLLIRKMGTQTFPLESCPQAAWKAWTTSLDSGENE